MKNLIEILDVMSIYPKDIVYSKKSYIDRYAKLEIVKNYENRIKIVFTRSWDNGSEETTIGFNGVTWFYGTATVIASSFDGINIQEIITILKSPVFGSEWIGFFPRIRNIRFTHLDDKELCLLLINSFLNDKLSAFGNLPKDIATTLVFQIVNINSCISESSKPK